MAPKATCLSHSVVHRGLKLDGWVSWLMECKCEGLEFYYPILVIFTITLDYAIPCFFVDL